MFHDNDFFAFCAGLVLFGVGLAVALALGIPWLWAVLRPWLHALTAV